MLTPTTMVQKSAFDAAAEGMGVAAEVEGGAEVEAEVEAVAEAVAEAEVEAVAEAVAVAEAWKIVRLAVELECCGAAHNSRSGGHGSASLGERGSWPGLVEGDSAGPCDLVQD